MFASRSLSGNICIPEFINDLVSILNNTDNPLDELVYAYTTGIESVADQHAPLQRKLVTLRPNTQWYSTDPREDKNMC